MVVWRCSCGGTTNELLSTCNRCHAPRESAPSADGYVERTVSEAQPRSAEELRDVAARLLALAEEKEGGAAPTPAPAAAPTAGGSSSEESDDEGAPAPVAAAPAPAPAAAPTAGGSSSDESESESAAAPPAPATPATAHKGPTKRPRGSPEEPIPIDDSQDAAPAAAPPTAGGSFSDDSEDASDDERDSKRQRRGDDSDDDVLVLGERTYLVERNRKLEDENEDLRRLAAQAPQQQGAMTQLFDELIHADDDADADRRRVERRGASIVRYFVCVEGRMEKILRLRGVAARCRGWRTKLDGIGAPRSLRENLGRLKGLRNAAAHEVDCERIAATTDDDLAGLIRDIDRDLKALEASAGAAAARRVTR
jgi:hypothetical protein